MLSKMINLRFDTRLIQQIDLAVNDSESTYASRTDFIRDAARRLLEEHRKQRALAHLKKYQGYGKKLGHNFTDEDLERVRQEVWDEKYGSE